MAAVAASIALQQRHCLMLGEDIRSAAVAAVRAARIIGNLEYNYARRTHRIANKEKHSGFIDPEMVQITLGKEFAYSIDAEPSFPMGHAFGSGTAPLLSEPSSRGSLLATPHADELPHTPVTPLYRSSIFTDLDDRLAVVKEDLATSQWELELATEEALNDGATPLFYQSEFEVDSLSDAEQFDALLLVKQWKILPLCDRHPLHAPFSWKRPIVESDYVAICKLSNQIHLDLAVVKPFDLMFSNSDG